jgi:hypothetical protein
MGQQLITRDQIEDSIGLAQRLHERRVGGLYVDRTAEGVSLPMERITIDEAESIIRFAGAFIEIEQVPAAGPEAPRTREEEERTTWFFEATDDPERRKLIFGGPSMKKLHELGSVPQWVTWLKETFQKSEAESRAALDREMRRTADDPTTAKAKWRTTIRVYSTTHSIRQKPLNDFNNGLRWMKLRSVAGKRDQLLIDLEAGSNLLVGDVYKSSLFMSRRLVMALSVGTLGYFWFHEPLDHDPKASGRFYEHITDLEAKQEVRVHRSPSLRLESGPARALDVPDLNRVAKCLAILMHLDQERQLAMCDRYHEGAAFIARTDAQMGFEIQGVAAFYVALKHAMATFGAWDEVREQYPTALRRFATETFVADFDMPHLGRLIDNGETINTGRPVQHAMTMNDVGVMKALCDAYLVRTFMKLDREWFEGRGHKSGDKNTNVSGTS